MVTWGGQPLRRKLAVLSVVSVAIALVVSGLIATASMRNFLVDQVDRQLTDFVKSPDIPGDRPDGRAPRLPSEIYIQYFDDDGNATRTLQDPFAADADPPDLPTLTPSEVAEQGAAPFTVPDTEGQENWRVVVRSDRSGGVAVARSLVGVDQIVQRLVQLLLVVGLIVLVVVGGLVTWLVRRSLQPLQEVEQTARSIASGDLSHRVPDYPDTTEVGQVSEAMNAMLERMEGAFNSRELALAESQSSEARMRQFVADASHELRTPLTSIRGFSELYRQGAVEPEDVGRTFERIEGESNRMGELVEDLLELARLDQRRPLELKSVDMLAVSVAVVTDTGAAHPEREIQLDSRIAGVQERAPIVAGDAGRIGQIVRNLVDNAVAYSTGPVALRIAVTGDFAEVRVIDSGPGIPDGDKGRVFERFYRADTSRTRNSGGSGLGLSIAQALAVAHGGQLSVSDNPSGGAEFALSLPLEETGDRD